MDNIIILVLSLFGLLALGFSVPFEQFNPLAALPCEPELCQLPDCLCSAQTPPIGNLSGPNLPQIVYITFDDAVTTSNFEFYEEVLFNRTNPNGAKVSATFFVCHEYANYSMVHELYVRGHDIALHSITHVSDTQYWSSMDEQGWYNEIIEQKEQLSTFAKVPKENIKGVRAPFLQIGGNAMYRALVAGQLEYDCSRPTQSQRIPGLWPYTNDYASTQDCQIGPCPDEAFPAFWTVPMIDFIGDNQFPCAFVDECTPVPITREATYNLLLKNFNDHYTMDNRAPFGIFTHAAWLIGPDDRPEFEERKQGYIAFLDYLGTLPDVYLLGVAQALEWVRQPTPVNELDTFEPWLDVPRVSECPFPRTCRYYNETWERFMSSCVTCPNNYPWLGDPLGGNLRLEEIV